MKRWIRTLSMILLMAGLALVQTPRAARADDDNQKKLSVTVAFGVGLNTAGAANHHVLPRTIDVKTGGVVHFVVAGFHNIFVYLPGTTPEEVLAAAPPLPPAPGGSPFINYCGGPGCSLNPNVPPTNLHYAGINPANAANPLGANPAQPPNPATRANLMNRVESVAFPRRGTYLVICNVNGHFRDGMFAFVRVTGGDDDEEEN